MPSRFEADVSDKFPSDGNHGTSGVLNAVFGEKVKVIKHDSNFGLEVLVCIRNLNLGLGICV